VLGLGLLRMLEEIETDLADKTAGATEKWQLRQRAEVIRSLLAPSPIC
jgi:hypothetical protein